MGWSDTLKETVGNLVGQAEQGNFPDLVKGVFGDEGLQTVLTKLKDAGFGSQVASWLDKNKDNLPITVDQLRAALGDQHVQQLAKSLGIPVDTILAALAEHLPQVASAAGAATTPTSTGSSSN